MTLFLGTFLDTPHDPFTGGELRSEVEGALLVRDGVIVERGAADQLRASHPDEEIVDLDGGLVLPGFVDTHVHFPQVRMIGALGMPLLDWLEHSTLPEEARLVDPAYAEGVATDFLHGLTSAGTTSALVFGAHYSDAMDVLFTQASQVGLRITSGLVVSDRILRSDLLTSAQTAYDEGLALAKKWHGVGLNRYAVTPRFSLSCSDGMLESCAALLDAVEGSWFTSHINENKAEVAAVCDLFDDCDHYLSSYDRHGLVRSASVFAHNVHATGPELDIMAEQQAWTSHCPTSNAALGSGMFGLKEHLEHGVGVALGSDVGGGTGFSLLKEGLQAYFFQQLLGDRGYSLGPAHLLHLATSAGAAALGMADQIGDFSVGKQFDAVWLCPTPGSPMACGIANADGPAHALAKTFTMGTTADVSAVYVGGSPVGTIGYASGIRKMYSHSGLMSGALTEKDLS